MQCQKSRGPDNRMGGPKGRLYEKWTDFKKWTLRASGSEIRGKTTASAEIKRPRPSFLSRIVFARPRVLSFSSSVLVARIENKRVGRTRNKVATSRAPAKTRKQIPNTYMANWPAAGRRTLGRLLARPALNRLCASGLARSRLLARRALSRAVQVGRRRRRRARVPTARQCARARASTLLSGRCAQTRLHPIRVKFRPKRCRASH